MRRETESTNYLVVEAGDTIEDLLEYLRKYNLREIDGVAFEGRGTLFLGPETHMEDYVAY